MVEIDDKGGDRTKRGGGEGKRMEKTREMIEGN